MDGDGDVRPRLDGGLDELAQERLARVLARARGALEDDRAVDLVGGFEDRLDLLHVVDVERGKAVAVLGGVIEQLSYGDERH